MRKFLKPLKLPPSADFGVLILRVGISALMLTHGFAKLQGFLGGERSFADPIGIGETLSYILTIGAEFGCSILLILGLFTRAALVPLIFTMIVVAFVVHGDDPFSKKEHAISFLIVYLTLFFTGPGKYSVDSKLYK